MSTNLLDDSINRSADFYSRHLAECPWCEECDYLMMFYIACDCCGAWGNVVVEHYPQPNGQTLCQACYDTEELINYE